METLEYVKLWLPAVCTTHEVIVNWAFLEVIYCAFVSETAQLFCAEIHSSLHSLE